MTETGEFSVIRDNRENLQKKIETVNVDTDSTFDTEIGKNGENSLSDKFKSIKPESPPGFFSGKFFR